MPNTIHTAQPIFGGEISAFYTVQGDQTVTNYDPSVPSANTFGHFTDDPTAKYVPMGFIDIPGVGTEADMDDIFPLGTFQRQQRNMMNQRSSARFRVNVQDIGLIAMGLRNASGLLNYYSLIVGNANFARQVAGAKCESLELDIPREGRVTAALSMQAILAAAYASTPPAIVPSTDYNPHPVYYGYNAGLLFGTDDYTQYISRVRISVQHTLKRLPPIAKDVAVSPAHLWILVSQWIKETIQKVNLTFELYQPLPVGDVLAICRATNDLTIPLTDYCNAGRSISIALPNVSFQTNRLNEGDTQEILSFSAEADARNIVVTQTST